MTQVPSQAAAPGRPTLDVDRAVVAIGVALLAAAVALSTLYSRFDGELDWSNYVVGLLATAGLLGIAAIGLVGVIFPREADEATDLVAWPGAFGLLGAGLMIGVALDDSKATAYVAGLAVLLLSAAGYAVTRRGPFVVTAVLGFTVVYAQLLDDVVGFGDGDDVGGIGVAVSLAVYAVVVTAAGWVLPTRALSGVVAGAITVAGFASLTGTLAVASAIQAAFAPLVDDGPVVGVSSVADYDDDAWVILVLALLLVVGWAACAALTRHVGFRILVVAMAVSVLPLATLVLRADHPTWWGVVVAAVGGALLLAVAARATGRSSRAQGTYVPTPMPGPPPPEPPTYTAPYTPPYTPPPAGPPPSGPPVS